MQTKNKAKDARKRIRLTLLNLTVVETEPTVEDRTYRRDIIYRRDRSHRRDRIYRRDKILL